MTVSWRRVPDIQPASQNTHNLCVVLLSHRHISPHGEPMRSASDEGEVALVPQNVSFPIFRYEPVMLIFSWETVASRKRDKEENTRSFTRQAVGSWEGRGRGYEQDERLARTCWREGKLLQVQEDTLSESCGWIHSVPEAPFMLGDFGIVVWVDGDRSRR